MINILISLRTKVITKFNNKSNLIGGKYNGKK